ncbi:MAG: hypothetical protein QM811_05925 [Pirellulales bacterium]
MPAGNGIVYLETFTDDPGMEPVYLAKIRYDDDAALRRVIDAYGVIPHSSLTPPNSFAGKRKPAPAWFPLANATKLYIFPEPDGSVDQYAANLWVNTNEQVIILERAWW